MQYPDDLKINNRVKLSNKNFKSCEKLYHGFDENDKDGDKIKFESIRFPDFSCNWSRFSKPYHVKFRENGKQTDGCYSFTVKTARYKNIATPVHDPITKIMYENYSHIEIRLLENNEDIFHEPQKGRKPKKSNTAKEKRREYRMNIVNKLKIEILPT
ncbi:MAG: hypothetical protein OEZ36_11240 [Spirochaetota bacterium]|nr:hypothetical protein [Spirochaetota bacterium]